MRGRTNPRAPLAASAAGAAGTAAPRRAGILALLSLMLAALVVLASGPARAQPAAPVAAAAKEGSWVIRDFRFKSGEVLPELRALAKQIGVEGASGMRKSELVAAIQRESRAAGRWERRRGGPGQGRVGHGSGAGSTDGVCSSHCSSIRMRGRSMRLLGTSALSQMSGGLRPGSTCTSSPDCMAGKAR